jgi:hypothetical protein
LIDPKDLTGESVGALVRYTPAHGDPETGYISGWNEDWVFVKYGGSTTGQATRPDQLEWVTEIRLIVTFHVKGEFHSQRMFTFAPSVVEAMVQGIMEEHLKLEHPNQVELCFPDEPDPEQRYYRIGTDPSGMVCPIPLVIPKLPTVQ